MSTSILEKIKKKKARLSKEIGKAEKNNAIRIAKYSGFKDFSRTDFRDVDPPFKDFSRTDFRDVD